jgi:ring-1,2-phenylacetyl-CoA epoxidase subunit PaaC
MASTTFSTRPPARVTLFDYASRLGDNALILGQRLGAWVGKAPQLEEEMALANLALDCIGQARLFYAYAAEQSAFETDEDVIAFHRDEHEYRNFLLVEQPNGNFAHTMVRHYLYTSFYQDYLLALCKSADRRLADIAAKTEKEIRYHVRHARSWLVRLGDGTPTSRDLTQTAVNSLWRFTGELFYVDALDQIAIDAGWGPDANTLYPSWQSKVAQTLALATVVQPDSDAMASGGKAGKHGESFGYLLAEMQHLQRSHPALDW